MGQDMFLLADVGGTNTRIAVGTRNGLDAKSIKRYRNDDYRYFLDLLGCFLAQHPNQSFRSAVFAIAGPINGQLADLTNRKWAIDKYQLTDEIGCADVHFVNDMGGLARALPVLDKTQLIELQHAVMHQPNDQSLVIGLGTGVNVSALVGNTAVAAEIGHAGVTVKMTEIIETALRGPQTGFDTIEDILSGRGLERLYEIAAKTPKPAAEICAQAALSRDDTAHRICVVFGTLLAELIRELALHYLPRNGIYLSGSVARGIFETPAKKQVIDWLAQDRPMVTTLSGISYSLITDDAAALLGCLEIAKSQA